MKNPGQLRHMHRYSTRPLITLVVGVVAALVTGLPGAWLFSLIIGWAAACVTYILWVWLAVGRQRHPIRMTALINLVAGLLP